jgi:hypothetical protein
VSRFDDERALPPIWEDGRFSSERIEWYTRLVVQSELIKGAEYVIPEFIAAMICESSLDNLTVGNNAKHGSGNEWLGISWLQLDTGYHVASLEALHTFRVDPMNPLVYVATQRDLCRHGKLSTHFNRLRWKAWTQEKIDPAEGWNPLEAAIKAWVATGGGLDVAV